MSDGRRPTTYSFTRYLAAKKSVDDRALNAGVWRALASALEPSTRILEVGCGTGTMVQRFAERGLLARAACYTAVDAQPENIAAAQRLLQDGLPPGFLELEAIDLYAFADREHGHRAWDLLVAHAFLDLVDLSRALPVLWDLLRPGGHFYFSLNFDGLTILEPAIDPPLDTRILERYHRTMDERLVDGRPSGDSRSGRHLFTFLRQAGASLVAAGSSDWVVFPGADGYSGDEAYFLHFIVHTIEQALHGHPELEPAYFQAWIAERHAQISAGALTYIAHQLDFFGQAPRDGRPRKL